MDGARQMDRLILDSLQTQTAAHQYILDTIWVHNGTQHTWKGLNSCVLFIDMNDHRGTSMFLAPCPGLPAQRLPHKPGETNRLVTPPQLEPWPNGKAPWMASRPVPHVQARMLCRPCQSQQKLGDVGRKGTCFHGNCESTKCI